MKFVNHLVSASILATSLATFQVPQAFAQDMSPVAMERMNHEDAVRAAFAQFTLDVSTSESKNSQVVLRQAMTNASRSILEAGVSGDDLIDYATSDMLPSEAKAFRSQVSALAGADLSSPEGEALLQKILMTQSKGSNFLPCGVGFMTALFAGTGAFVLGIVALTSLGDATRMDRQNIEKDKAAINSEIDILRKEGVSENSYLITSRQAELVQLDIEYNQMLDDKERNEKNAMTMGLIAGGLAVAAIVGGLSEEKCY